MLTGAAFGIVFLYLLDTGQAALAGLRSRPTGPVILGDDGGLGPFRTSTGRISVAPLGDVEVGQAGAPAAIPETGGSNLPRASGGSGNALNPANQRGGLGLDSSAPTRAVLAPPLSQDASPAYRGSRGFEALPTPEPSESGRVIVQNNGAPNPFVPNKFIPNNPSDPNDPNDPDGPPDREPSDLPGTNEVPQMLLVLVRVTSQSDASSVDGKAISQSLINQHSVADSVVDMREQTLPGFEMRSELYLPATANSLLSDADLELIS